MQEHQAVTPQGQERERRINETLRMAKAQGMLWPIFDKLEELLAVAVKPIKVENSGWALKRAQMDGEVIAIEDMIMWLTSRANSSPDGAENTEEQHGTRGTV